ncbi:GNAT family N-acetyltransferase [Paenibacillus sp. BSR1-1]|uniref:GNAT family N-acetyltransferase n=1 Tax=Paenibacillus sp. BSR1-1 TaxID=3020845 RepID=UPI0025B0B710|nr:GNAT family N-acetyltransferase [Paenibacillus sp. BSR1-1]MDN3017125.1 GNAT family N-acetyltransferase [Paenibacillus sp. BSR1-1]
MLVREVTEAEFLDSMKLSMYAFQYKVPESELPARKEAVKNHRILGIWDENLLAAKLHIIPLNIYMNDTVWKMGGIAGVATYPEYRRNGYVKALMIDSLKQMRDNDQIVSLLHPFDISFYRKYGWEILSEKKKITIGKIDLKFLEPQEGFIRRYSKETHNEEIEQVYEQFSSRYTGMLKREPNWWKQNVYDEDSQLAVYYNSASESKGYILYHVKDKKMDIEELVALDHEARIGLWNFICQHDSMVETVTINLASHDPFPYFLKQPRVKTELFPYFMARIVDAEECLQRFSFNNEDESLFLHLEDTHAPWNNGSYLLGNGETKVFKEKAGAQCVHPPKKGIQLNINSLSAILFGCKRPMELYEMGFLTGAKTEIDLFEKKVPVMKSAFFDFF